MNVRPSAFGDGAAAPAAWSLERSGRPQLRVLIHLDLLSRHRLRGVCALANTLAAGGHQVLVTVEERTRVRLDPSGGEHRVVGGRGILEDWKARAPGVVFQPLDTFVERGEDVLSIAQDRRRKEVGAALAAFQPSLVVVWGGAFDHQAGTLDAIERGGFRDKTVYMEAGWFPQAEHLHFDRRGVNRRSSLVGRRLPPLAAGQRDALARARARVRADRLGAATDASEPKTVFAPLQIESDTSFRFGSPFASNAAFIEFMEAWLPADWAATFRLHPKERLHGPPPSSRRKNFRITASGSLDRELRAASHVVGINSTVLLEAALLGKRVIAFGDGLFAGSGAVVEAATTSAAEDVLAADIDEDARERFLHELMFKRQVSLAALENRDYAHLASHEPFETILDEFGRGDAGRGPGQAKIESGEAMIKVGNSRIARTAVLDVERGGEIVIGDDSEVRNNAVLEVSGRYNGTISIGNHSVIGVGSWLQGSGRIEIGDDVIIGPYAAIVSTNHQYDDVSTPVAQQPLTTGEIVIENDVWLGAHVTVALDVRIGAHSIIGANSFVNADIPPYSIAVGSPARVVRSRKP